MERSTSTRQAVRKALSILWNVNASDTDSNNEDQLGDMDEDQEIHEALTENIVAESESGSNAEENEMEDIEMKSKDGTNWVNLHMWNNAGRVINQNIFTAKPGIRNFAIKHISSAYDAWNLLIKNKMLSDILVYTNEYLHINEGPDAVDITMPEIKAFIGLVYLRGVFGWRKMHPSDIWSLEFGSEHFRQTMARSKFQQILKYIRFDSRRGRHVGVRNDLFYPFRDIMEQFVANSKQVFQPYASLTIDEQLLPLKNRCRFLQYMPNKPDKFGIKLWIVVDVKTKYCLDYFPYLGAADSDQRGNAPLGEFVVKKLMNDYLNCGYNVTVDNFFTTASLASYLLSKKTTIVGTVRHSSRSIIPEMKIKSPLFESHFFKNGGILAVAYQAKVNKKVILFSTMHSNPIISNDQKRKPEVILYYNENKVGVDCLDSMLRLYSCKAASRRWPMGCFYDLLDKAALNSWILYNEAMPSHLTRRQFIRELGMELCQELKDDKAKQVRCVSVQTPVMALKRCLCSAKGCKNKTSSSCQGCSKMVCGAHSIKITMCESCSVNKC